MTRTLGIVIVFFAAIPVLLGAQETEKDPQASVDTAIPYAIKLLEAKDYKGLIDNYVPPEDLKKMKEAGAYEIVIQKFGEGDKPAELREALTIALKTKPEINDEKNVYTFKVQKEEDGEIKKLRPVVFKKIEERWYLGN